MLRPEDLRGRLLAEAPVPRDAGGAIDARAHERLVEHVRRAPVGGVVVWASLERAHRHTEEERAELLGRWRRAMGGGRWVVAGVGTPAGERRPDAVVEGVRRLARQAAETGADALVVVPPVAFRGRGEQNRLVLELHAAIAEAGLPTLVSYLDEAVGGIAYDPLVLRQLLARREVLGIHIATQDRLTPFQEIVALWRGEFAEKALISGQDRFLGYSLMGGAQSLFSGLAAIVPELVFALLDAHRAGDAERFLALSGPTDELARVIFASPREGRVQRILWALAQRGIISLQSANDPEGTRLGRQEYEQIGRALARLPEV